jgi:beta-1,4-mannosyl-glycoprotein beta-1,4-N-acetylglucosaminyltransferase
MKIYDCFPFFNELDLLEIRLNILNDVVDYFVISECTHTFTGNPKPLHYEENKERFKDFHHKIIYSTVEDSPVEYDTASREIFQKNQIHRALQKCNDEDIILISDLDEIPKPEKINEAKHLDLNNKIICLKQNFYLYYLNYFLEEDYTESKEWNGTRIMKYGVMKRLPVNVIRNPYLINYTPEYISGGGWHFTFLGGKEKILEKLDAYAHQEFNIPDIRDNIDKIINENTHDLFFRKMKAKVVDIDSSYPKYIVNNIDKYKHLIKA